MRKIFGLLALMLIVNSCDDGEIRIDDIDFSEVSAANCGNIVYKLKDTEALFFEVANHDALFANDETLDGAPRTVPVNASNRIFYRAYSGEITSDNICGTIPPATPSVMEEWTFTGNNATIEVITTAVIVANPEFPGGEKVQQYRHQITFRNVFRNTPDGSELVDFDFGFYTTTPNTLPFNFGGTLEKCGNVVTNINGSEALSLDIDPSLIQNAVTPVGEPRQGLLGTTTNKLLYSLFQSAVTDDYFCLPAQTTPTLIEQWYGESGVANVSGIIEVTTVNGVGPNVYDHEIRLKNVVLTRGNTSFTLASDYVLGTLTTN